MPELPEVETIVRALRPHLLNRKIEKAETFTQKMRSPLPPDLQKRLRGKRISGVRRRGKYIIVDLDGNPGMILHLGMTGAFRVETRSAAPRKHDRVIFDLDNGKSWRFEDIRKFGELILLNEDHPRLPESVERLGPEPLTGEFNGGYLKEKAKGRKTPVKVFILDQKVIAGIGNIYASESLFLAGIRPGIRADGISRKRYDALAEKIKEVLSEAIKWGGTTISDYKSVDGSEGKFALKLNVYGREGEKCGRCGRGEIKKIILGGRSSFYCPVCQK
jgi:formamidopyrimidine-DNA glycosylase